MAKVIGLDLSLTSPGLAEIRDGALFDIANYKSKGRKDATLYERERRLYQLYTQITDWVLMSEGPDLVVVEAPSYGSRTGSMHDRSGLWWMVVSSLRDHALPVVEVPPRTRAKYGTGSGNGDKAAVMAQVSEHYLPTVPNDDVADAILLAAMGARYLGEAVETHELSAKQLEAMEAVKWPLEI